jgi:hypothetical protein
VDKQTPSSPGELGVRNRHEGGHFFVPDLDEFHVIGPLQRTNHAFDDIAWIAVDAANAQAYSRSTAKSPTFISRLRPSGKRRVRLDQTLLLEIYPEIGRDLCLKRVPILLDLLRASRADDKGDSNIRRR